MTTECLINLWNLQVTVMKGIKAKYNNLSTPASLYAALKSDALPAGNTVKVVCLHVG